MILNFLNNSKNEPMLTSHKNSTLEVTKSKIKLKKEINKENKNINFKINHFYLKKSLTKIKKFKNIIIM